MTWDYEMIGEPITEPLRFLTNLKICGEDGWELVSTNVVGDHIFAYFKRPSMFTRT
jgi:hypothetical protein